MVVVFYIPPPPLMLLLLVGTFLIFFTYLNTVLQLSWESTTSTRWGSQVRDLSGPLFQPPINVGISTFMGFSFLGDVLPYACIFGFVRNLSAGFFPIIQCYFGWLYEKCLQCHYLHSAIGAHKTRTLFLGQHDLIVSNF